MLLPAALAVLVVAVAPFLVVAAFGIYFSAEHVETVANVEHGIGVNAIILGVATTGGVHPAFIVGLLAEQVVEVECYDERLVLQEWFRYLSVPQQFVGVH